MNRLHHAARLSRTAGSILAIAALLLTSLPATAAELMRVRVGAHEGYTRVVFELDRAVGYRVERVGTEKAPMLRVTLEAGSGAHDVGAHGDVRGVKIDAGFQAVARIPLRRGDLRLQEMMLSNPPRIVLDLRNPDPVATAKPTPKAKTAVAPKPAPKPVAQAPKPSVKPKTPTPAVVKTPTPVAVAPKPAAKPKPLAVPPKPEPLKNAQATKPALKAKPEVAKVAPKTPTSESKSKPGSETPSPTRTAALDAAKPATPESDPKAAAKPGASSPLEIAAPTPSKLGSKGSAAKPTTVPPRPALLPPSEPWPPTAAAKPVAKPAKPAKPAPAARPSAKPAAKEPWLARLTGNPLLLGAMAGGLVALVGIGVTLRRRSRALPSDLDVNAIAEELDDEDDFGAAAATQEAGSEESSFGDLFSTPPVDQPTVDTPVPSPQSELPGDPAASAPLGGSEFDVEEPSKPSTVSDFNFDEASQGETPMNQDMDLPADPNIATPPPAVGGAGLGGAASSDVSRMLEAFERRMQGLEAKLEEANEAREKLERQVAAQSEELRVQRAAIARTQRALRTMSRGDEDKATEPALRDGDTQAKTRISE